jgi:hypothetical protein
MTLEHYQNVLKESFPAAEAFAAAAAADMMSGTAAVHKSVLIRKYWRCMSVLPHTAGTTGCMVCTVIR